MALISYWKLQDLTDEQALNNLTNVGADQVANGYDFEDGLDEHMTAPGGVGEDDYDFGANAAFTFVFWVKIRNTAANKMLGSKYTSTDGWYLYVNGATGVITFLIKSGGAGARTISTTGTYEDNTYHMVAIRRVAGSSTIKLWVDDGETDNVSGTGYAGSLANYSDLHIGAYSLTPTSSSYDGEMGNTNGVGTGCMGIQVYGHELSDADLEDLYATAIATIATIKNGKIKNCKVVS